MKIRFETATCGRCGGSGEFSYNPRDGRTCFGCQGSGKRLSRAGAAARKIYDEVMKEMAVPANTVRIGDHVLLDRKWRTVEDSGPTLSGKINQDNWKIDTARVSLIVGVKDKVTVWSQEVARKAMDRVKNLKGVTVVES